ncbi:MAG: thiamine pyrophosphate-dependent enzyme [Quadrisphaera sp.]
MATTTTTPTALAAAPAASAAAAAPHGVIDTETGELALDGALGRHLHDVDDDALRALHRDLVLVRRLDTEATALQRQGELALWAPLRGQEAAQVGSARALRPGDFVFGSYREHGVAHVRGVDPTRLLRFWRGSTHSGWNALTTRMTTPAIVVGSQVLHAVGYAMGVQRDGTDDAVITYFGDGATSQGDFSEALGFAAATSAPVVFFCQNNQWAISAPVGVQTRVPVAQRADGFGIRGMRVDGNDVLAVLAATREALAHARSGAGPVLVEAVTYRLGPHTTSDDPTRYRDASEVALWEQRDPLPPPGTGAAAARPPRRRPPR